MTTSNPAAAQGVKEEAAQAKNAVPLVGVLMALFLLALAVLLADLLIPGRGREWSRRTR